MKRATKSKKLLSKNKSTTVNVTKFFWRQPQMILFATITMLALGACVSPKINSTPVAQTQPAAREQVGTADFPQTNLKTDESVLIFPTNAVFNAQTQQWQAHFHGWVFEAEKDSIWRNGLIQSLALVVGAKEDTPEGQRFENRSAMFLVDNERDKTIVLTTPHKNFVSPKTGANGHFEFSANLPHGREECRDWLAIHVHTNKGDTRNFSGRIQCLAEEGVSVISDIDDTIKDSNVLDKKALMKKTFLKEFSSVRGMSDIYRHWQSLGYNFHYVSSSPWQLYPVLSEFIDTQSFPHGSMHLKLIRVKDKSIFNLLATPEEGKVPTITELLNTYPKRRFILVGDSGERDAHIYASIAKQYPDRIVKIYIRDVRGDKKAVETIFMDLPKTKWVVFSDSNEILSQNALLNPGLAP